MVDIERLIGVLALHSRITSEEIARFEKTAGISLPLEYVEFLKLSNGAEGFLGPDAYVILWELGEILNLNHAYKVVEYAPNLLLFGSSGGGDAYGFDTSTETMQVLAVPFVHMSLDDARVIAPTFGAFLEALSVGRSDTHPHVRDPSKVASGYPGKEICEIKPVKLGGTPTDPTNKMALGRKDHVRYVTYWNGIIRGLLAGRRR